MDEETKVVTPEEITDSTVISVDLTHEEWDMIASLVGFAYVCKMKLDNTMKYLDNDCYDSPFMNNIMFGTFDKLCEQAALSSDNYIIW